MYSSKTEVVTSASMTKSAELSKLLLTLALTVAWRGLITSVN